MTVVNGISDKTGAPIICENCRNKCSLSLEDRKKKCPIIKEVLPECTKGECPGAYGAGVCALVSMQMKNSMVFGCDFLDFSKEILMTEYDTVKNLTKGD